MQPPEPDAVLDFVLSEFNHVTYLESQQRSAKAYRKNLERKKREAKASR